MIINMEESTTSPDSQVGLVWSIFDEFMDLHKISPEQAKKCETFMLESEPGYQLIVSYLREKYDLVVDYFFLGEPNNPFAYGLNFTEDENFLKFMLSR